MHLPKISTGLWSLALAITLAIITWFSISYFQVEKNLTPKIVENLPGPNGKLSKISLEHLNKFLINTPNVLGAYVTKTHYETRENPVIWFDGNNKMFKDAVGDYIEIQLSGKGKSSITVDKSEIQTLRNSEEAKRGYVVCGSVVESSFPAFITEINDITSICRAPIPPFSTNANLTIVVATNIKMSDNTASSVSIRRALLELQVDIFNRDYAGSDYVVAQSSESLNQRKLPQER